MGREKDLSGLQNEDKVRQCPDCKCEEIEHRNGEFFCKKCGLVIESSNDE